MKVFVACSSMDGLGREYLKLASDVATLLVRTNHKLLFSGKDAGMSEKCFMTFKYESGKTKAILDVHDTSNLESLEVDAYDVQATTFERNKELCSEADLVLILPGGIEVVSEFVSILDENNTKKLNKPIVLFNYNNFYTPLLKFFESSYKQDFLTKEDIKSFTIVDDIDKLIKYLKLLDDEKER